MTMTSRALSLIALLTAAGLLGACSTWNKIVGDKADYKQSRSEPSLEIPPDLSSATIEDGLAVPGSGSTTLSEYSAGNPRSGAVGGSTVLIQPDNMRVLRDGDDYWLRVEAPAEAVWPKVHDFWLAQGFLLTVDDPSVGILETDWAENRADIPQDFIRGTIGKALDFLYAASTRDRFRVRLERAEDGATEVLITHRGMEEVVQGTPDNDTGTIWKPRPSDPELEAEMLTRLMVYMGTSEEQAKIQVAQGETASRPARTQLIQGGDGTTTLMVEDGFSRAWRNVGLALDRIGFTVEDRDRSNGVYFVRYNDPLKEDKKKGFLSKLAFWSDDDPKDAEQYRILLSGQGERTQVTVQNAEGGAENTPTARRILTMVHEQMQ